MIEALSQWIAVGIKKKVPDHPSSVNVLRFALAAVLNGVFIVSFSLIISLALHRTMEAATALIAFALLRQLSGGIHLKSGMACVVVSTTGITLISLVDLNHQAILIINIISIVLSLIFSPSRIEKQTKIKPKYFPLLKISSTLLIAVNIYVNSPVLAVTFFVQCLTLIRKSVK